MSSHWPKVDIRINLQDVLFERIDGAIRRGWTRAHKHTDKPTPDAIQMEIFNSVHDAICELLSWGADDIGGEE